MAVLGAVCQCSLLEGVGLQLVFSPSWSSPETTANSPVWGRGAGRAAAVASRLSLFTHNFIGRDRGEMTSFEKNILKVALT